MPIYYYKSKKPVADEKKGAGARIVIKHSPSFEAKPTEKLKVFYLPSLANPEQCVKAILKHLLETNQINELEDLDRYPDYAFDALATLQSDKNSVTDEDKRKAYLALQAAMEESFIHEKNVIMALQKLLTLVNTSSDEKKEAYQELIRASAPLTGQGLSQDGLGLQPIGPVNRPHYFMKVFCTEFQEEALAAIQSLPPMPAVVPPSSPTEQSLTWSQKMTNAFLATRFIQWLIGLFQPDPPILIQFKAALIEYSQFAPKPARPQSPSSPLLEEKTVSPALALSREPDEKNYLNYVLLAADCPGLCYRAYLYKAALNDEQSAKLILTKYPALAERLSFKEIVTLAQKYSFRQEDCNPYVKKLLEDVSDKNPNKAAILLLITEPTNDEEYKKYLVTAYENRNNAHAAKHINNIYLWKSYDTYGDPIIRNRIARSSLRFRFKNNYHDQKFFSLSQDDRFYELQGMLDLQLSRHKAAPKNAFDFLDINTKADITTIKDKIKKMRAQIPPKEMALNVNGELHPRGPRTQDEIILDILEELLVKYLEQYKKYVEEATPKLASGGPKY